MIIMFYQCRGPTCHSFSGHIQTLHTVCRHIAFLSSTDLADLNLPKTCQIDFPDPDDLLNFQLIITPDEVSMHPTMYIYMYHHTCMLGNGNQV